jgi:recombination protein RecR
MKPLKSLQQLTESFHKLPGVGLKSAERMAQAVLSLPEEDVLSFADSLKNVKSRIHACPTCGLYTEDTTCEICQSTRPFDTLVVVSFPKDVFAFERLEDVPYRYHILGGVLSASKGIHVHDLHLPQLFQRIEKDGYKEIILAMNPTLEGETTAQYLAVLLKKHSIRVTRLGYGLPMGATLDYADAITLSKALSGRTNLKGDE